MIKLDKIDKWISGLPPDIQAQVRRDLIVTGNAYVEISCRRIDPTNIVIKHPKKGARD